jgi:hypothetical protein
MSSTIDISLPGPSSGQTIDAALLTRALSSSLTWPTPPVTPSLAPHRHPPLVELRHHGKVNVIVDALSRKAHCNYLPTIRLTGEESSTRVLPNLSLFNITLTPTLRAKIIAAQKDDEGMDHIKRRMREGDPEVACFHEDAEGILWFKERLVVPKREALKKKMLDEAHTSEVLYSS